MTFESSSNEGFEKSIVQVNGRDSAVSNLYAWLLSSWVRDIDVYAYGSHAA